MFNFFICFLQAYWLTSGMTSIAHIAVDAGDTRCWNFLLYDRNVDKPPEDPKLENLKPKICMKKFRFMDWALLYIRPNDSKMSFQRCCPVKVLLMHLWVLRDETTVFVRYGILHRSIFYDYSSAFKFFEYIILRLRSVQ